MDLPGGGTIGFRAFAHRLYAAYDEDAVSDTAAQLSYYLLFALFPILFFAVTIAAYLPLGTALAEGLERLRQIVPGEAMKIIETQLTDLVARPRPHWLGLGAALGLWSASRGIDAFRKGLNLAYDVKESRGYVHTQLVAIGMTLLELALMMVAFAFIVLGGKVGLWLSGQIGISTAYALVWSWLRWPLTALVMMVVAALAYFVLPDVKQKFRFITPGSLMATLGWLAATWGFGQYADTFGNYNVTYGSIGGVIVLMTWLYISSFIFLLGGEVNAILEHASRVGKAEGARAEGERPPPPEERPSAVPPGAAKSADVAERAVGGAS